MYRCALFVLVGALAALGVTPLAARAATPPSGAVPYALFAKGAVLSKGLIPILEKAGNYYFVLSAKQIGKNFIESSVPATGLGGFGPAAGEPYVAPARIFRFSQVGEKIVMNWPPQYYRVTPKTARADAVHSSFPNSVIAVVPILAKEYKTGAIVVPAAPFLGDVANMAAQFQALIPNPMHGYHLDPTKSFFTVAKALPGNDVLRVSQSWASFYPTLIDNVPDARSVEVKMTYNITGVPHDGYMPRIADDRVGYFEQALLNFQNDKHEVRNIYYVSRWNFAPATPGKPSNATHPLVFFIASNVPLEYRQTIRDALLTWNNALTKIGILNAIKVHQQPTTKGWDPDDIRHNMVSWVDTTNPQFGAEALIETNPLTGEELNVGVNVDAIMGMVGNTYKFVVAPARGIPYTKAGDAKYVQQYLRSVVLHESGHDMGLQHNFIGSEAYTAKDLQSKAFTAKYGVATSVMEYAPINLWPQGTPNGDYVQLVLGPYDYYAIRYGYAYVPNAATPRQELPTLNRWASKWANPTYRFASDEDAAFAQGHAIDPRVAMFDLTNHPLAWCGTQMAMDTRLFNSVTARFPRHGRSYDQARRAFLYPFNYDLRCSTMAANTIGGEYLSRNKAGDPGAWAPLTAVPLAQEVRAWNMLSRHLFGDAAWNFNANVLRHPTYTEVSSLTSGGAWVYNPTPRHDIAVAELVAGAQDRALNEMFAPLTLQRIDELPMKYGDARTMSLVDLFNWSRASIYGNVTNAGIIRRNLQTRFTLRLARMWLAPMPGTPSDAQALARENLVEVAALAKSAAGKPGLHAVTRAHLLALAALADRAVAGHLPPASPMMPTGEAVLPASLR